MRFLSPLIAFGVVLAMAQSSQEVAASASAQEGAVFARSSESPKDTSCLPDCVVSTSKKLSTREKGKTGNDTKPKQQECFNSKESSRFFRRLRKSAKKFCDKHYRGGWEYKVGKCMKKTCSHYSSDMAGEL
jgi:hypothetical protein